VLLQLLLPEFPITSASTAYPIACSEAYITAYIQLLLLLLLLLVAAPSTPAPLTLFGFMGRGGSTWKLLK
jgi:hypothetical protein